MFESGLTPDIDFATEQEVIDGIHKGISAMVEHHSNPLELKERGENYANFIFKLEKRNASTISEFAKEMMTFCYCIFEQSSRGKSYSTTLSRVMEFGDPIFSQSE